MGAGVPPSNNALKLTRLTWHDGFGLQLNAVFYGPLQGRAGWAMAGTFPFLIAAALASAACHGTTAEPRETEPVVEAAFRQQSSYWLSGDARDAGTVVCFAVDQRSLRLRRSLAHPADAAARDGDGSECEARPGGAIERSTGHPAVLVTALEVEWIAPDEAWVTIRHYRSEHSSGSQAYRVVRDGERWVSLGPIVKALPLA
jgi:hypothetical protein